MAEECRYCGARFEEEDAYLDHLATDHEDELGRIDRRRIAAERSGPDDGVPIAIYVAAILVGVVLLGLVYFAFSAGDADGGEPHDYGAVHHHGTLDVVIDGAELDWSEERFVDEDDAFHYHPDDDARWHVHARGVTLSYALSTLGIEVTETTVTFEGTTYDDAEPDTTVSITVDGEPVAPDEYVLSDGDRVEVVVETE